MTGMNPPGRAVTCPACRQLLDGHMGVGTRRRPRPGDATVCAYCATVAVFTDTGLRLPAHDELERLLTRPSVVTAVCAVRTLQDTP